MRLQRRSTPIGGLELVSLPVRSAALLGLSGERRRAHGSLRVLPRPGASCRRRARPQDSTAPRLGSLHAPPTLLPVAPARRLAGLPQPSLVALSAARRLTFAAAHLCSSSGCGGGALAARHAIAVTEARALHHVPRVPHTRCPCVPTSREDLCLALRASVRVTVSTPQLSPASQVRSPRGGPAGVAPWPSRPTTAPR